MSLIIKSPNHKCHYCLLAYKAGVRKYNLQETLCKAWNDKEEVACTREHGHQGGHVHCPDYTTINSGKHQLVFWYS